MEHRASQNSFSFKPIFLRKISVFLKQLPFVFRYFFASCFKATKK